MFGLGKKRKRHIPPKRVVVKCVYFDEIYKGLQVKVRGIPVIKPYPAIDGGKDFVAIFDVYEVDE